jgi:hypothetical protein
MTLVVERQAGRGRPVDRVPVLADDLFRLVDTASSR